MESMKHKRIAFTKETYAKQPSKFVVSNTGTLWMPLVEYKKTEMTFGIDIDGNWILESSMKMWIIGEENPYLFCMPFLEMPFADIKNALMSRIGETDQIADIGGIFPFVEIIRFALENSISEYWIELAMNWFDELDAAYKHALKPSLEKAIAVKRLFQKTKHRVQRELKRLSWS